MGLAIGIPIVINKSKEDEMEYLCTTARIAISPLSVEPLDFLWGRVEAIDARIVMVIGAFLGYQCSGY
jgi:hypothetical protein